MRSKEPVRVKFLFSQGPEKEPPYLGQSQHGLMRHKEGQEKTAKADRQAPRRLARLNNDAHHLENHGPPRSGPFRFRVLRELTYSCSGETGMVSCFVPTGEEATLGPAR